MKKLLGLSIMLALLVGFTTAQAQGPIQVVNGGTNLNVITTSDTTNSPIIANVYQGQAYTVYNASGGTNGFNMNLPAGASFTIFTNSSGGVSIIQKPAFTPSGYRVGVNIYNPSTNFTIGVKLTGNYPATATPDRIVPRNSSINLYFEDGYNGPISARAMTNIDATVETLTYSDYGN